MRLGRALEHSAAEKPDTVFRLPHKWPLQFNEALRIVNATGRRVVVPGGEIPSAEYEDVFVLRERAATRLREAGRSGFLPDKRVAEPVAVRANQIRSERLSAECDYRSKRFEDAPHLAPEPLKIDLNIPMAAGFAVAVREVSNDELNGASFDVAHPRQTVAVDEAEARSLTNICAR